MKTGHALKVILASVRITPVAGCRCVELMRRMNEWGPNGCRIHFFEIVNQLEEDSEKYRWRDMAKAAGFSVLNGLAFKIDWMNPIPDIVKEAIRVSEESILAEEK